MREFRLETRKGFKKMLENRENPVLSVSNLSIAIGKNQITHNVYLNLYAGKISALVGESGSGKSLTSLALMGLLPDDFSVSGKAVINTSANDSLDLLSNNAPYSYIRSGLISMVFQEPSTAFNPVMRIGKQIEESLKYHHEKFGKTSTRAKKSRVLDSLSEVGLKDVNRVYRSYPHELSGGQLQRAMIAMAIINQPSLLIADEPTTALDVTTQRKILQLLRDLAKKHNIAVLIITHNMSVVKAVANTVYVMNSGSIVESGLVKDVFSNPKNSYTRSLLDSIVDFDISNLASESTSSEAGDFCVNIQNVSAKYAKYSKIFNPSKYAISDLNLNILRGKTHALVGESGAGKTTIAKLISGQLKPESGSISIEGLNLYSDCKKRANRKILSNIGFIFQDSGSALNPLKTVGWSIAEPLIVNKSLSEEERKKRVELVLNQVHLPLSLINRFPHELSGGQKQRVGIARALINRPSLIIADEPTSALDANHCLKILNLLSSLQKQYNFSCLFITHDLALVSRIASQVSVIKGGRIVEQGSVKDVLRLPKNPYTRSLIDAVLQ